MGRAIWDTSTRVLCGFWPRKNTPERAIWSGALVSADHSQADADLGLRC
jgi:hypothetical protein